MKTASRQSTEKNGFILLSVLFTVTLLITSATAFAYFARNEMKRAGTEEFIARARSAAEVACREMSLLIGKDNNKYDSTTETLYSPFGGLDLTFGDLKAHVTAVPLDNKIPFTGILLPDGDTVRKEYEYAWTTIWDKLKHPEYGALVLDFMDNNKKQRIGGREADYNINRPASALTDLTLLPEMDSGVLYGTKKVPGGLNRYLTPYGDTKININTAPPEVIALLDSRIGAQAAANIAAYRVMKPIKSLKELESVPGFPQNTAQSLSGVIEFRSICFQVKIEISSTVSDAERKYIVTVRRSGGKCSLMRWEE